jgi:ABC-2 type transport system ATP-binding protein
MSESEDSAALIARGVSKTFRRATGEVIKALDDVSLTAHPGTLTALVGPDGAGKTTLIRLATGLLLPDEGKLEILGIDVVANPQRVQDRIGYMPQKFGLYEDLTVQENMDLYADLHGVGAAERRSRYPRLMEMTALGAFTQRLAGNLSGGMKQKLGLACTLVRAPDLLFLDEPTVGVDPLSRRELWEIIYQLVRNEGLSVVLSTSYLDEAERCDRVIVLHEGGVLAQGHPGEISQCASGRVLLAEPASGNKARELQARLLGSAGIVDAVPEGGRVRVVVDEAGNGEKAGDDRLSSSTARHVRPRLEDGFMVLLRNRRGDKETRTGEETGLPVSRSAVSLSPRLLVSESAVVDVRDLVRRFGSFTAVDHVSFDVHRGEIFGLLGPNGAGKTTTFRMLCGLLPATGGTLRVAGTDLRHARASARQRIGYMAQKFSLYGQLSVSENLDFFASAYGLRGTRKQERIEWALHHFGLAPLADLPSGNLPGGFKQRLAMAAALLHEPEILFLDEATSGADPLARREFWRRITTLSGQGVTVVITTHFMEEAEYCDRVAIMDAGRVLAQGTSAEIRARAPADGAREPTMEDAFIAIVEQARVNGHASSARHLA